MSFIKVQRAETTVSGTITTISIDTVADLDKAFVRVTNVVDSARKAGTGTIRNNNITANARLINDNTIEIRQTNSSESEIEWEVWEYTGEAGGPNEFIVRFNDIFYIDSGSLSGSFPISGVNEPNKLVPFHSVREGFATSFRGDLFQTTIELNNSTASLLRQGQVASSSPEYAVVIVEFTGSNWSIQQNITHNFATGSGENVPVTLDTPLSSWDNAFVLSTFRQNVSDNPPLEMGYNAWAGPNVANAFVRTTSGSHAEDGESPEMVLFIVESPDILVQHIDSILSGGADIGQGGATANRPLNAPVSSLLSASVIATAANDSELNNNASGLWNYRLTTTTNLQFERFDASAHKKNTTEWAAQIVQFGGIDRVIIPNGIQSLEEFGDHALVYAQTASIGFGQSIPSLEEFGDHVINAGGVNIVPTGIASLEEFGTHSIAAGITVDNGIPSLEEFGDHFLVYAQTASLDGIQSLEEFGDFIITSTGINRNAKQDTVLFVADGGNFIDRSQYLIDLTSAASNAAFELSSSRTSITHPRELFWQGTITSGSSLGETLIYHGAPDGADFTYLLGINAFGQLTLQQNGLPMGTFDIPWTGTKNVCISVCSRENPLSDDNSNAIISEWFVYNHSDNEFFDPKQFTHVTGTTDATWTFSINGRWDGATMQENFIVGSDLTRIGKRFHTHVEAAEDWVSQRSSLTTDEIEADINYEPLRLTKQSGLANKGEWVGQAVVGGALFHNQQAHRLTVSPLVNVIYNERPEIDINYSPSGFIRKAKGSQYRQPLQYLRWIRIPNNVNRARVRINVRIFDEDGLGLLIPVGLRVYSFRSLPHEINNNIQHNNNQNQKIPPFEQFFVTEEVLIDNGNGAGDENTGQWFDLGILNLSRFTAQDFILNNTTHITPAILIDPNDILSTGEKARARVIIRALQVYPISDFTNNGYLHGEDQIVFNDP